MYDHLTDADLRAMLSLPDVDNRVRNVGAELQRRHLAPLLERDQPEADRER